MAVPRHTAAALEPFHLDHTWLAELGFCRLPTDVAGDLLASAHETLHLQVGWGIAERTREPQLDQFEEFIDAYGESADAEAGALAWLAANVPNHSAGSRARCDVLTAEIRSQVARLLAHVAARQGNKW